MALACQLAVSADMQGFLDGIDKGKYLNSTVMTAQISYLLLTTTIILVVRARPLLNVAAEVDALEKHAALALDPIKEARPHMTSRPWIAFPWERDADGASYDGGTGFSLKGFRMVLRLYTS